MIEWVIRGKALRLSGVPKSAELVSVHGKWVMGTCKSCGRPVYDNANYQSDDDGIVWHRRCPRGATA